ncbi:hypothetical protein GCM10027299_35600 [Larkinella ripae]
MITLLCCAVLSVNVAADSLRIPKNLPELPGVQKKNEVEVMPNAKPSTRPNMPVHRHDERAVVPIPNSASHMRSYQLPLEKPAPADSTKRKNSD